MKPSAPSGRSILLCGYRGSGKSTVGRLLAERLHRPFFDTDEMVVQGTGETIKDIFREHGESHFRDLEASALQMALVIPAAVIALGGGALTRDANQKAVRAAGGQVIYLAATPEELFRRVQADMQTAATRPNLAGGGIEEVRELLRKREPTYRSVAALTVDVTMLKPAEVADKIVHSLKVG